MVESRNWVEMPDDIMGGMILQRLDAVEILTSAQKVCRNWRRICKDPAMWKTIDLDHYSYASSYTKNDFEKLCKQAVHRSCGELIDIRLKCVVTNDLLDFISRCSSKLKSLRVLKCYNVTGNGLIHALKRLPCLETLDLFYISIEAEHIKVIGQSCPHLKSFKMKSRFMESADALAIANSMPALRHLQLFGRAITGDGLRAILHGCRQLESLDLRRCSCLMLGGSLGKLCRERIKDFKFTVRTNLFEIFDSDSDDFDEDDEFSAGFPKGVFDNYWI
ncbi:hypothetical protein OSB04_002004 [Centaurea solstitialis]|uniref:F-box domain-containing protein n=1 Tax=Centaurea solstitialis TaxID=347529 RepID=A0AA38TS15_9ASTR|nr:hypothetical protein OSB04_002004 [Centaurea solstitialis]